MLFSEEEHQVLAQVCDCFVGPVMHQDTDHDYWNARASDIDLVMKVEAAASKLPAEDVKDLKKVLKILSGKELGLTWGGPLKPFSNLTQKQREKLFFRWSKSSIGDLRKAFNVFRKLSTFLFYSENTENIQAVHDKMGYTIPLVNPPENIPPLPINQGADREVVNCEYLIIGSGAGGGLAAGMLASAGRDVVLVEKGPYISEQNMTQREGEMVSSLYDRGGALATKDANITIFAGSCLGGGTTINWNASFETPEYILNEWALEHQLPQVVQSDYAQSAAEVKNLFGINTGNSSHNVQNQKLWNGASAVGCDPKLIARNVEGCKTQGIQNCGFCGHGCKAGCRNGTLKVSIRDAARNGAKIYCNAEVLKLNMNGSKARGAEIRQIVDGVPTKFEVKAKKVIVACGAIHTPALLMRSGISHPELGKNLFFHPTVAMAGLYDDKIEPWFGPMMTTLVSDSIQLDGNYGYWIETPPVHPGVMAMTLPWVSRQQHKEDLALASHCGAFIVLTRDKYGGKVSLDKNGSAVVQYKMHSYDLNHSLQGMKQAAEIHLAAGAREVLFPHRTRKTVTSEMNNAEREKLYKYITSWRWRPNDYILYSAHQMSTCRMGGDAKKHPVQPNGKLVGHENIYIVDGSVLPSCPGINPMISILTLSHYTLKNLIENG